MSAAFASTQSIKYKGGITEKVPFTVSNSSRSGAMSNSCSKHWCLWTNPSDSTGSGSSWYGRARATCSAVANPILLVSLGGTFPSGSVERSVIVPFPPGLCPAWKEGPWHPGMALLGNKLLLLLLDPINAVQGVALLAGLSVPARPIAIIITLPPLIAYLLNKTSAFLLTLQGPETLEGQCLLQVSLK